MTNHDKHDAENLPADLRWILDEDPATVTELIDNEYARELIELIGLLPALKVLSCFAGLQIYLPTPDRLLRRLRDNRIRREFTGANHAALARKYGLAVAHVYRLLKKAG